jgi:hypothetical protein
MLWVSTMSRFEKWLDSEPSVVESVIVALLCLLLVLLVA